jgi:hypothetical protein
MKNVNFFKNILTLDKWLDGQPINKMAHVIMLYSLILFYSLDAQFINKIYTAVRSSFLK